jgi:membrane protease YdiL (CAAX protease family)
VTDADRAAREATEPTSGASQGTGSERGRALARQALAVTAAVYVGYGLLGLLPIPADFRYLALVAAFYFLPGVMLRRDPERQRRWQVGPERVIPPWSWNGARWFVLVSAVVFPIFVLGFFLFYARACEGDLRVLAPVTWVEGLTPWAGGLEHFLGRLCRSHEGDPWPATLRLPAEWLRWGGLGIVVAVAVELFAIALPEEVFHRGYLMSALEERWPPRRRILGAPLGLAAVVASLAFAVGHLVGMAEAARLFTFFPALVFSWLWRRSGSLWAPSLFHAAANLLMAVLIASTFPP